MIAEGNHGDVMSFMISTPDVLTIKNNIFYHTSDDSGNGLLIFNNAATAMKENSNNLFHRSLAGADINFVWNGSWYTRTTLTNFEASALDGDPTFTTEFTNLNVQTGSEAIDGGVDVGLSEDFNGDAVGDPPNIGISETTEDP